MTVGAILQTAAFGLPQLIVGRIVTGVGNGCESPARQLDWRCLPDAPAAADTHARLRSPNPPPGITATVPVWQSECARAEHRGRLG